MNRTDRLVALVMFLQSRRLSTAAQMAEHFAVTLRTIYRDLSALGEAGVPIVGEAGVGYSLMRGYHLPPIMFSPQEALAIATGGLFAERMTDASVGEAMQSALGKVTAVLPPDLQNRVLRLREAMQVRGRKPGNGPVPLSRVQMALAEARVLRLRYHGLQRQAATERVVEPLGLVYYLEHWHLIAWCRLREDARDFRVDRIERLEVTEEAVPKRPGVNLAAYLSRSHLSAPHTIVTLEVHPVVIETVRRHWGPTLLEEHPASDWIRVKIANCTNEGAYLARWILSLGTHVRVVAPAELRDSVIAEANRAIAHHNPRIAQKLKRS